MSRGVLLVGLLFVVLLKEGYGSYPERVLLQDIQVITLHQGKYTNARRSTPILQLACTGGTAGCSAFVPQVVQCYNRGSDGYDAQWECKTEMDKAYRFGQLEVSCEGYDYPDDPYILKGSCGLEYKLDLTGVGNHQHGHRAEESYYSKPRRHEGSSVGTLLLIGLVCLVIFVVYKWLIAQPRQPTAGGSGPSMFGSSAAPPPPGFRPEYMPGSGSSGGGCSYPDPNAGTNNSGLGGFWTGATTGGVLGYLFGSRNNAGYQRQTNYPGYGSSGLGTSGFGSGWGASASRGSSSSSSSGSGTRTTSGFGGTKRR